MAGGWENQQLAHMSELRFPYVCCLPYILTIKVYFIQHEETESYLYGVGAYYFITWNFI